MYLKKNRNGIYYICEGVKKEGKWTQKYLVSLGVITKEEAGEALERWKERKKIKPIYRTIVIDPPWEMKKSNRTARPNQILIVVRTLWSILSDLTGYKFLRAIHVYQENYHSNTFVFHACCNFSPKV